MGFAHRDRLRASPGEAVGPPQEMDEFVWAVERQTVILTYVGLGKEFPKGCMSIGSMEDWPAIERPSYIGPYLKPRVVVAQVLFPCNPPCC